MSLNDIWTSFDFQPTLQCKNPLPRNILKFNQFDFCRKTDGRKYAEGVSNIKDAEFPFPADSRSELCQPRVEVGHGRNEPVLVQELAALQERLHEANVQLEQANSDCVVQRDELKHFLSDKEASSIQLKQLQNTNAALKRKIESYEPVDLQVKLPRPGPPLKAFEDLTPRQQKIASNDAQAQVLKTSEERGVQPAKLSAYLTYRCDILCS